MSAAVRAPASPAAAAEDERASAWSTLRRGLRLSPELRRGLPLTLLLAVLATGGRVVVPLVLRRVIDGGLATADGGAVDLALVARLVALAAGAIVLTSIAGGVMLARLVRATETALSALRVRTFAHVHDLAALHVASQQRGALVARVTADPATISQFMQWGGTTLVASIGQVLVATIAMAVLSVPLTAVVLATFVPMVLLLRGVQKKLSRAYDEVRGRVGDLLSAVGESVVAAPVIRAYGAEERTARRVDAAVDAHYRASYRAIRLSALGFTSGELTSALATSGAVVVGVLLGVDGAITAGTLVAFLFFVAQLVAPVQTAIEIFDQAQTAIAGWRRILDVVETPIDVPDPGADGVDLPDGPLGVELRGVALRYPGATRPALADVDVVVDPGTSVAVVGETGSGKTTLGRLVVRLLDPTEGVVAVGGVPLPAVREASLRARVLLVPQEGFLFDGTIADNVRFAAPDASDADLRAAFAAIGLDGWLRWLPEGLATPVGERGGALSAGERQLVALARAAIADPDLVVLDEATSAVDPATEQVIAAALRRLLTGRTALVIAHRLSTAEAADRVLVVSDGRIVEDGPAQQLARGGGAFAALAAAWRRTAAGGGGRQEPEVPASTRTTSSSATSPIAP